nr:hypothetical protein [Tanacetum cinerariifolium]
MFRVRTSSRARKMSGLVTHDLERHEFKVWDGDCMMVVEEILNRLLEKVEKLEWWFEQDIDNEEEVDEEGEGGSEVWKFNDLNNRKDSITWQSMVWMEEDTKDGLAKQGNDSLRM